MAGIISNKYTGSDAASPLSWGLVVKEVDGIPTVGNVNTIIVSNGTLTDNGGGVVTILTSGGGGGGAPSGPQYAVQLNDGAGNFIGSANYTYDYAAFELTVNGKIIMNNIVEDTTGIDFSPVAANPGTTVAETLWSNSTDANNLYYGANPVLTDASTFTLFDIEDDTTSTTTISRFDNLEMSGGTGISTALAAGPELIFTNTGVTSIVAGTGITISGATGAVTINSSTTGTVTSVATANSTFVSLAGGPITTTGTLTASLSATGTASATTFLRGDNTWAVPGSGLTTFTVSGDGGVAQTIADGDNLQILGSTVAGSGADLAGVLDTVAAAGDLLYVETREMTGASGVADGATGFAPKALTGEEDYYLAGDATWKVLPINYSWTVSDGTTTDVISDGETVQFQGTATQLVATVAAGTPALVTYALVNVNTSGSGAYAYPSNITVDLQGRITAITAGGSGGGTVTSITFSDGANTDTITTTGTIEIVGGTAIDSTLNPATGIFTLTSTGVNSLANVGGTYAGTGASYVIPSAATGSGIDLELTTTGVAAGSYSATNLTVDAYGRLTAASDGSASIVNTKFYIEDDAANNELVSTNDTILLKEGLGGVSVVVSNPDTVTYGLDTTGVAAASYIAADITVDAYGRLSAASQGTPFTGGANVGIVPTAAAAANNTYLEKDGTWTDPLAGLAAGDGISFAAPTISVNLTASTGLQFNGGTTALEGTTFTTANIGMVPAPGAINNYFLRDDGTWVAVGGSGTVTSVATANSTFVSITGGPITTTGTLTASLSATGTASAGTFLRGDNTWATPGGGFSNFNISDGVTTQTINSTDTITFTGGTALTGAVSATDTVTYSLDNTAVTPGSYTYGSFTVDQQGRLTAASSGGAPGTMSSWILTGDSGTQTISDGDTVDIAGGTGITTVASATDTLTVTLDDTAVTPGSYTYSSLTVDQQGRLTAASSGTAPGTMSSFTAAGSSGPSQTISDGDTFTIAQGTGITSVASATDTITITNTGVTSIVAGTNISISGATGAVTINSTDQFTGTVTSVATSSGTFVDVTGGPITTTGTISGDLSATGTADATTFLRGDNTWASPAGSFTFDAGGSSGPDQTISSGDKLTIAQGTGITSVASATDTITITNTLPFNSLILAGDSGSETILDGDTITIAGGTGLTTVAAATDTVTVTLDNTSVAAGSYTYSSLTVDAQGRLTAASSGSTPGTMDNFIISGDSGSETVADGDTITFTGGTALTSAVTATDTVTFNLDDTAVTPGSYTVSNITVDQQGRITAASSGSAPGTMDDFNVAGDSGTPQTISNADTMTITGGTALSTVAAAFDTITVNLDSTAVAAGSYTNSSLTVDAQGRLTAASSGATPGTMDNFIISDGVTTETVTDGETITFADGTFIDQTVTATDTVTSDLSASGTASAGTFLRGDNTWATPAGGFSNFSITDGITTEVINSTDTITFTGGTGLTGAVSVADTVTFSLDNTAVTPGSYTYSSITVDAQGRLTSAASGSTPGTMDTWTLSGDVGTPQIISDSDTVDIAGGTGITTTASATDTITVDMDDTVVTPGSYTYSSVTVDQQGRLTAASSGVAPGTMNDFIISDGSTTQTIVDGDTLLFTASTGISAVVSATDTLTITNTLPFNNLSLAGDSGPTQTITDGNTITVAGGTGISSVASATDTVTLNLDNTAVVAATYGSATEVAQFTVDAQGRLTAASDVTITFPFSSFDIATDPVTATQTISDTDTLTFTSGTFITQTVAATDTVTGDLSATGTASASTFLRGDNTWASPAGSFTFDVEGSSGTTETISSGDTLIIAQGTGISSVSSNPDTVTITNTGVTSNVAGTGISVSGATGAVTISNTGVTSIVAGTNISISGATGAVTINSTDQFVGTVTSVATSSGTFVDITGGPITTTGTISGDLSATGTASATTFLRGDNTWGTPVGTATSFDLTGDTGTTEAVTDGDTVTIAGGTGLSSVSSNPDTVTLNLDNTAVTGGSYTYGSFTVDAQGRLTAASSGATPGTMSDWTLQGDGGGAPQTIANSDTVTIAGGTGLTTTASATDTVTIDLDTTTVAAGAYGSATDVATFTVDAQGRLTAAADVAITFPGTADLIDTYVGYGDGSNLLTGSANYTWTTGSNLLTLGSAGAASTLTGADGTASAGSALTVSGGDGVGTNQAGGNLNLSGGTATGVGTSGSIVLTPGVIGIAGTVNIDSAVTNILTEGALRFQDAAGGDYVGFQAPTAITASQDYELPANYPGVSGEVLSSTTAGVLSWVDSGAGFDFIITGDGAVTETISDGDTFTLVGGTGLTSAVSATDTVTYTLDDTVVTAASYGDTTNVASFTVDQQGRLTAASDVAITFPTVVDDLTGTTPINVSAATGSVTISSDAYTGTTGIGYVPSGGTASTYLRGDGTWADPGAEFNFTVDADTGAGFTVDDGDAVTITATGTGLSFDAAAGETVTLSGTLDVDHGGTGQTSYTDGQLLIGNTTGTTLAKGTLTAGTGIGIVNGGGSITISNSSPGGSTTFDITDGITTETIADGDTLTFTAGTGVTAVVSSTDTLTITNTGVTSIVAGTNISISGATGAVTIDSTDQFTGTVTSVGLGLPAEFSVTGSPVTTSGTLTGAWTTQTANTVFAGPTTGAAATPAFRALVAADVPNPSLTATEVGYGSVANALTGISTFTFDDTASAETLTIGTAAGQTTLTSVDGSGATGGANLNIFTGDGGTTALSGSIRMRSGTGGSTSGNSGEVFIESGATTSNADATGGIMIRSGSNTDGRGTTGTVTIATNDLIGAGTAGSIILTPGNTVGGNDGNIILDYATWPIADAATPGDVLSSDAGGVLSWVSGSNSLTATYVGYGDGANALTGTSNFTWTDGLGTLTLAASGATVANIVGPSATGATAGGTLNITAGSSTLTGTGGNIVIRGGTAAGSGTAGSISLFPANSGSGTDGSLILDYATWPDADASSAGDVLSSDGAGNLSWATASGGMTSFIISGDSGPSQTITDGNTIDIAGGTGISSVASATDTVTLNLDDTAVTPGSYTYSSITVDQQGRLTAASSGVAQVPGGATTNVQFNNAGTFDGDANFAWTTATGTLIVNDLELTNAASAPGGYTITGLANNITLSDSLGGTITIADAAPASAVTASIVDILPDNIVAGSKINLLRNTVTTVGTNGPFLTIGNTALQSLQEAMVTVLNRTDDGAGTIELVSGYNKTPATVYGATLTLTDGAEAEEDVLGPISFFARKRDLNLGTPPIWTTLEESKKMALGSYSLTINSGGGGAANTKEGIIDPQQESFTVDSQNYGLDYETTAQVALNYQLPHNAYKRQEVLHINDTDFSISPTPSTYEYQLNYKDHAGLLIIFQDTGTLGVVNFVINMPDATESNVGDTYWLMSIHGTFTPSVKLDPGSGIPSVINGGAGTPVSAYQCQRIIAATNLSQPVLAPPGTGNPAGMSWVTMATNT